MADNIVSVVYKAIDPCPPNREYLLQFYTIGKTKPTDGSEPKEVLNFLPIHFVAGSEEQVTKIAEAWYAEQMAKEQRRKEIAQRALKGSPRKKEAGDAP